MWGDVLKTYANIWGRIADQLILLKVTSLYIKKITVSYKCKILNGLFFWLIVLSILSLTGCSAFDKENWTGFGAAETPLEKMYNEMKHNLDQAIDEMTYDEALFYFGQPSNVVSDDQIIVASWKRESIFGASSSGTNMGNELVLSFDKDTKILKGWRYKEW